MIRYYTYYSCGGYKDIYVGSDSDSADASYFIPLINVWKKNNKPSDIEKIARAESVQQTELVTKNNPAGFPSECILMFSHGGYNAINRTLIDGRVCLCIRDISNGAKDEEGRDIPFNFMFLADGKESIARLDGLALEYIARSKEINALIADAISYDHIINGIKFDLSKFNQLFSIECAAVSELSHKAGTVEYLIVDSRDQFTMALAEQGLDSDMVNSALDSDGLFCGRMRYMKGTHETSEEMESSDDMKAIDSDDALETTCIAEDKGQEENEPAELHEAGTEVKSDNSQSCDVVSKFDSDIAPRIQQMEQQLSILATAAELDSVHSELEMLSDKFDDKLNEILQGLKDIKQQSSILPVISPPQGKAFPVLKNKSILIAIGCLIVGFILGALIF